MDRTEIKKILEAAMLASREPLSLNRLEALFKRGEFPDDFPGNKGRQLLRDLLAEIESELEGHGYQLQHVASGYRFQVNQALSPWVSRLWDERPPRYSRALMETLALIAYRQPVTRGDIEQVRGVSVSANIMRTMLERGWIRVVGQRQVPGRPSLYGTTRAFLDYFNLKSLDELPPLSEIKALMEPLVVDDIDGSAEPDERGSVMDEAGEASGPDGLDEPASAEDATERQLAQVVQLPTVDS